MLEYKVYLYLDSSLKNPKTATFTSLEKAEELYQIGLEEGCYKYILVVRDIENDIPIETKSIYYDDYDFDKEHKEYNKKRKKTR